MYLEILANYLTAPTDKKDHSITTENRNVTIQKRETSLEGLVSQFESGEDGIYNLIQENKNALLTPKLKITKQDIEDIPLLAQIRESIAAWKEKLKTASPKDALIIKKTIIELQRDQYLIKDSYKPPATTKSLTFSKKIIPLNDSEEPQYLPQDFTLRNPKICSIILCNYSRLVEESYGHFDSDLWHLMQDFDDVSGRALQSRPDYLTIVEMKIDGAQNKDIQLALQTQFGLNHTAEYISNLWRQKIPALIAETAQEDYLYWFYLNKERGTYKRCTKCGQTKLATTQFFNRNSSAKDGFYSICKKCRNKKT